MHGVDNGLVIWPISVLQFVFQCNFGSYVVPFAELIYDHICIIGIKLIPCSDIAFWGFNGSEEENGIECMKMLNGSNKLEGYRPCAVIGNSVIYCINLISCAYR